MVRTTASRLLSILKPPIDNVIDAEITVVGSGPGGAITAAMLAAADRDVLLIEEGAFLPLESAVHFSREEVCQKYRNGGVTVGMGKAKVGYVEGRCVGGGSEINRGLYHRPPPEVLEGWKRAFCTDQTLADDLMPHVAASEQIAKISHLPGPAPTISEKLDDGARALGWHCMEVPRLFSYAPTWQSGSPGVKQSMTETFIPRYLEAGGRLLPETRVRRLERHGGRWHLNAIGTEGGGRRPLEIRTETVFVACGAVQTAALLRRSGFQRNVGNTLAFHPMIKAVARFPEPVNGNGSLEPVHQVKEFDPNFSLGCSISKPPAVALAMMDRPESLAEFEGQWEHAAIYYAQTTGGRGVVRPLPGFDDPLVRVRHDPVDMQNLAEGLRRLAECLLAAGAETIYPNVAGCPPLRSMADLRHLPDELPPERVSLTTLHMFSSCPMGEARERTVANSFGKVHDADDLHLADASLLCGPTVVNPQGTIMALAHRNVVHFLEGRRH